MAEPKKGDAAPLEGTLGPEMMMVANIAFTSMTLGMCQNLGLAMGAALEAPLLKSELASIQGPVAQASQSLVAGAPGLKAPTNPFMSGPKMGMGGVFG